MYQNYIFDLYGTLVDIHTDEECIGVWEKLAFFYGYYNAHYTPCGLKAAYQRLVSKAEAGQGCAAEKEAGSSHESYPEIQIENVFRQLYTEKGVQPDQSLVCCSGQFFRVLSTDYIRLYDGVRGMLQRLKEKGRRIYLLSNAQKLFTEYELRLLDISRYFDGIALSSEQGIKKPDARFYRQLMDRYGLRAQESIMIGNDIACDIEGAANAGLDAHYVHSNLSPQADAEALRQNKPMAARVVSMQSKMDISVMCKMLGI